MCVGGRGVRARRDSWMRRQIQFGAVGVVDHLLVYLSGRAETGVTMSLCVCV